MSETEIKREKESTYIEITRSLRQLENAIDKFGTVLAGFKGEPKTGEADASDRIDPPVGEVWATTSPNIDKMTKILHEKIEQLEQMFS